MNRSEETRRKQLVWKSMILWWLVISLPVQNVEPFLRMFDCMDYHLILHLKNVAI